MKNTELGRLVLKQVTEFPETFNMKTWGIRGECRTLACLAGHAMLLSGYSLTQDPYGRLYVRPDGSLVDFYASEAQGLLGMSSEERMGPQGNDDIFLDIWNGLSRFAALLEDE